ncbi:MAG TPA: peroxiredoxin [Burkholderiaceae bacterium]|nr:peroxiredoxin [Burkholderiaceae bacterium]
MSIQIGERIPDAPLGEFIEVETEGCAVGPTTHSAAELAKGKRVVLFAVPGAFTPTCSEKHLPGYLEQHDALKSKGIDEIWCVAVNDAFVMGAWGRDHNVQGRIRMLADGSGEFTKAMGLELDLTARGLGVRSQRYSALIEDGVVRQLNVDEAGKLDVSAASTMLASV